jgi:hypothetical protein
VTTFPTLNEAVRKLEEDLSIRPGFLEELFHESSDWSFVIKVHALLEAALTHLIVEGLGKPELAEVVGHISTGDTRKGRLVIAQKLKLLENPSIAFVRRLSSIRNSFVHDPRNVSLRIEDLINAKPNESEQAWRELARGFASDGGETIPMPNGKSVALVTFASQNPRQIIWLAAMNTIALIYHSKILTVQTRKWASNMESLGDFLVRNHFLETYAREDSRNPDEPPRFRNQDGNEPT